MSRLGIGFLTSFWLALVVVISTTTAPAQDTRPRPLLIDGKPINPLCLLPISDETGQSTRISLNNCGSDIIVRDYASRGPEWIGFSYTDKNEPIAERTAEYNYRYVGQIGEKAILFSNYSGGGSGHFTSLVALKRRDATNFEFSEIAGGDRCNGAISNITIQDNRLYFDQVLTPWMLMQLGLVPENPAFDGLASSATSCVATAHMRGSRMVSVTLDGGVDNDTDNPRACFDKTIQQFVAKNDMELDIRKLRRLRSQFRACLARG